MPNQYMVFIVLGVLLIDPDPRNFLGPPDLRLCGRASRIGAAGRPVTHGNTQPPLPPLGARFFFFPSSHMGDGYELYSEHITRSHRSIRRGVDTKGSRLQGWPCKYTVGHQRFTNCTEGLEPRPLTSTTTFTFPHCCLPLAGLLGLQGCTIMSSSTRSGTEYPTLCFSGQSRLRERS